MGNDTTHISPCTITNWDNSFVALVTEDDLSLFNFVRSSNCPSLTPAPTTPENLTPGFAVHAPIQTPGDALQFTVLPIFLPVPYGVLLPTGNFRDNAFENTFSDATYPLGRVWHQAMTHLHATNEGKPFHLHNGLFNAASVLGTNDQGTKDFAGYTLATDLSPTVSVLQVWDPLYKVAFDHCNKFTPPPPTIQPNPDQQAPTTPDSTLVSALLQALVNNKPNTADQDTPRATLTEHGKKLEATNSMLKTQLLLSYVDADGVLQHPTLNPAFTECILATTSHTSTRLYIENLADFIREHQTPSIMSEHGYNPLWPYVNLDMMYDKYLATVTMNCDWFQGHPDTDKAGPSKSASVFAFCAPDTASIEFQLRTASGLADHAEHVAGEHASKRQKTSTDILLVNRQHDQGDPLSCIANTFAVIRFMLSQEASDSCQHTTPIILRILMAFGNLFREPQFVRWVNYYLPAYAWLPHCLIMELHSSLRPIFQLLSYQGYRKAVAESRPIDAKVFLDPWDSAMATINRLRGNIFSNKLGDFALRPTSYGSYICPLPKRPKSDHTNTTPPIKNQATKTPSANAKPTPKDSAPPSTKQDTSGLVTFVRDGNAPPHCKTILAKLPNGNLARLCSNYIIQGLHCKLGATCPFVHLNKVGDLVKANRVLFSAWVKDTPSLSFPTQTPSGNTTPPAPVTPP
jgi:hypothetical protein